LAYPPSAKHCRRTNFSSNSSLALVIEVFYVDIGASLKQKYDGYWIPLGFFSRKPTFTETRYCTYDRELPAILSVIKLFQQMVEGVDFVIKMDYKPPIFSFTQKLDRANLENLRTFDFISQFSKQIVHLSGERTQSPAHCPEVV
jgi:hypothetical protein